MHGPSGLSTRLAAGPLILTQTKRTLMFLYLRGSKSLQLFFSCGYKTFIPNRNIMSIDQLINLINEDF